MPPLFLFHTTDGGANWTQIELPPPAPEIVASGDQCGIPQLAASPDQTLVRTLRCIDFERGPVDPIDPAALVLEDGDVR